MQKTRFTVLMLEYRIKRCMTQEKQALSLGDWNEADWCRTAAREWGRRLKIAQTQGYWEYEYEALAEVAK